MIWPEDILLAASYEARYRPSLPNEEEPGYIHLAPPLPSLAEHVAVSPNGELVQGLDDS